VLQPLSPDRPEGNPTTATTGLSVGGFEVEREHRLEKLEFALAVALTRGDQGRVNSLRQQIAALGGNQEEPGT
jgi:hypothetical protein